MGVSHQYCGSVGKKANCQVSAHIALSNGEVAAPVAARLFLPQAWIEDGERRHRVGVPKEVIFRSKPEIACNLPPASWRVCRWSGAEGKTYSTRLAWIKAWMVSDLREDTGKIPETWMVVDWPEGKAQPYHIYTAWLDGPPERLQLLRLSRQRFQIEQYFQRDKDDLGLDHFEGRSWLGFHHHLTLAATAYLFILIVFLRAKKTCLTWEAVLRKIRPFLIHSRGFCPFCKCLLPKKPP